MAKSRKTAKDKTDKVEEAVVIDDAQQVDEPEKGSAPTDDQKDTDKGHAKQAPAAGDDPAAELSEEVAEDVQPDPEPSPAAPVTTPPVQSAKPRPVVFPMLLGGAVAAALGFAAARYPDQWPFAAQPDVDPVQAALSSLGDSVSALEGTTAAQSETLAALQADDALDQMRGELSGELAQMRTQFDNLSTKLVELENRIHTVEKLPQGSGMEAAAAAAAAYERELQQMRQMLDDELARISDAQENAQTLEVSAAEAAKAAAARAAMARVMAALATGRPYGDALFDVTQNASVEAPPALLAHADEGVPTQSALQATFPEAARAALDASVRAAVEDGSMDRVTAFLRTQLGARSLEPKEGDDPDAILSRAEAALKEGRLDVALTELEAMPDAGKPELAPWIAQATARKDALAAGEALAQHVNSN